MSKLHPLFQKILEPFSPGFFETIESHGLKQSIENRVNVSRGLEELIQPDSQKCGPCQNDGEENCNHNAPDSWKEHE